MVMFLRSFYIVEYSINLKLMFGYSKKIDVVVIASDSDVEVTNDERQVAVSDDKNDVVDDNNDDEKDVHFNLPDYNFDFLE